MLYGTVTLLTGESCVKYEWIEHQFRKELTYKEVGNSSYIIMHHDQHFSYIPPPPGNLKTSALIHVTSQGYYTEQLNW